MISAATLAIALVSLVVPFMIGLMLVAALPGGTPEHGDDYAGDEDDDEGAQ